MSDLSSVEGTAGPRGDKQIIANLKRHGWHISAIESDGGMPGWAFTCGLTHSLGHPDLAVFGLPRDAMGHILNEVGAQIRTGLVPAGGGLQTCSKATTSNFATATPRGTVPVRLAQWFNHEQEPSFLQIVWPNREHVFPGEPGFGDHTSELQPHLGLSPREHPAGTWRGWAAESAWPARTDRTNGMVYVSETVTAGERPVLGVSHEADGDWQFLDGAPVERSDQIVLLHLWHVLARDASIESQMNLKSGTSAGRERLDGEWTVTDNVDG